MCTNLRIILIKAQNPKVSSEGACLTVGRDPLLEEKVKTLMISSHCESRPFVNDYIKKKMNFLIAENFVFF